MHQLSAQECIQSRYLTLSVPRTSILVKFVAMPEPQILYLKYALLKSHNPTYFHVSI